MIYNQDPLYIDEANGDLRLTECSPAIDAGNDTANNEPNDLGGEQRIFDAISGTTFDIDMGAFEYQNMVTMVTCYADNDDDGFGDANDAGEMFCLTCPNRTVQDNNDCNDNDATINPDAQEICDGVDNNCNGQIDEGFDQDGDGFTTCQGDCNDVNPLINPNAVEVCDGVDNNCNGNIDEGFDADGDTVADCFDNCPDQPNTDQADSDCDGVGDVCDLCDGGDDSIDNNNDGLPDCAFPPAFEDIIADWKCGNNKVFICHVGNNTHTICVNKNAIDAHIGHGDYLGPCGSANCDPQPLMTGDGQVVFEAEKAGMEVRLNWATDLDDEIAYYEIERSADGQVFETILDENSKQAAAGGAAYQQFDVTPNHGYNFYRLRFHFNDGRVGFTEMRRVSFARDLNEILLYPNPVEQQFFLNLKAYSGKKATIQIINNLGQVVQTQQVAALPANPLGLSAETLQEGQYFVRIQVEGHRAVTRKMVVMQSGRASRVD